MSPGYVIAPPIRVGKNTLGLQPWRMRRRREGSIETTTDTEVARDESKPHNLKKSTSRFVCLGGLVLFLGGLLALDSSSSMNSSGREFEINGVRYEEDAFGSHSAAETAPLSTIATAMMFGAITFASVALGARSYLSGHTSAIQVAADPRSKPLDVRSFASVYTLLHHTTVFGLILFFAYICEYHPPFAHSDKSYDRDEFFMLTGLLFIASAYTIHKNDGSDKKKATESTKSIALQNGDANSSAKITPFNKPVASVKADNDVLNRDQTEEWKGWMQFMFLLYHYYHAEEVYNSIRIMITCYVWMTGFGNFSFFYLKADYSAIRVMQMLWRLNFLVIFLCLSQGTTYILYYICPLHTYFFIMVYVTMRAFKNVNYSKYGLRLKLLAVAIIIFCLWDLDTGMFRLAHWPFLSEEPKLGANGGSMWEWYFRSTLDHWSTFLGMVFAANFPITSLFYRKLEAMPPLQHFIGKAAVGSGLLVAFYFWVTGPFMEGKLEYNATNSYYGFIPMITYIYFRNLTPTLRSYSLDLLHQIGKTTLETYLMQHHIWLTSNAKSLLTIIPGWPKMNMLLVTFIYFYTSRRLYKLTLFLRGMLMPDDTKKCVLSYLSIASVIGAFYALALSLDSMNMVSLGAVAMVSSICGTLLYQIIMTCTWSAYESATPDSKNLKGSDSFSDNDISSCKRSPSIASTKMFPPVVGAAAVLVIGLTWHSMAQSGAAKIHSLPRGCNAFVNEGMWISVDACNEGTKGNAYRDQGVSSFATCSDSGSSFVWGWKETPPYTQCRFVKRDAKGLKNTLKHRKLVFIGDSMTRNLYYANLRSLGLKEAGAYDTSKEKHADYSETIGDITIDFKWAPQASDLLTNIQDLVSNTKPGDVDLIVTGGGSWDRLHLYGSEESKTTHKTTVDNLAKAIRGVVSTGIPIAWFVPTTINNNALLTDEKKKDLKEEDVAELRKMYAEAGILSSSSFVLDGPSFSSGRVIESYDGVHYPLSVYDAGAQILANAFDWILHPQVQKDSFQANQPGKMAQPLLGVIMLCLVCVGLFFFDGFLGFSYLASLFVKGVKPNDLFDEAFTELHEKMKLPPLTGLKTIGKTSPVSTSSPRNSSSPDSFDEEISALIGTSSAHSTELTSRKVSP